MKRTSNSRSSLFLMELIIAILFFSLVSAVCLKAFARSHILSQDANALNDAVIQAESTAELIRSGEAVKDVSYYSSSWQTCEKKEATYILKIREKAFTQNDADVSSSKTYRITVQNVATGKNIYSLRVIRHIPLTVKEEHDHE